MVNKRLCSIVLIVSLIGGFTANVQYAKANILENSKASVSVNTGKRSNFKFTSKDPKNTLYTYNENGKLYKVEEHTNSTNEATVVNSMIYVQNKDLSFSLDYSTTTTIKDNKVTVVKKKNGQTNTYVSPLRELVGTGRDVADSNVSNSNINQSINAGVCKPDGRVEPDDGLTPWIYSGYREFSTRFYTFSYASVSAVVAKAIAPYTGGLGAAAYAFINAVIAASIPVVFYCQDRWLKYEEFSDGRRWIAAEKTYNKVYEDSYHKVLINSFYNEQYGG